MLTEEQRNTLDDCWSDLQSMICAEIHRNGLTRHLDDILDDAVTRTITSTAVNRLTTVDAITGRARSCSLDAIKTAARKHRNSLLHREAVLTGVTTIRGTALRPDVTRKVTPRNFRPELFYVAMTTQESQGMTEKGDIVPTLVPCLQFASYGADFIE
jgi:hypothetical protein